MTKRELVERLGTQAAIASLLGISRQAVSAWPDEEPIPPLRMYELKERRPDLFQPGFVGGGASDGSAVVAEAR